jgi:hypothetical protein
MTNPSLPTGRTIVLELVKEMEERLYPLMYRTVPPSVYHVYLHPEDYRAVEAVVSLLVVDAQRGLNARVDELNRRSRLLVFVTGKQPPIEVPAGGWEIHIQQEPNGEVVRGDFRIESRLSLPATPTYHEGVQTTRIGRTTVSGGSRRTVVTEQVGTTPVATAATTPTTTPSSRAPDEPGGGFARLAYVDEQGPHLFVIRKDLVAIGRGGSAHWVDVQIVSSARVSRVHCRIRRDPDGRFLLQDVSTWGTSIDGERVPPPASNAAGQGEGHLEGTGVERELPAQARIQLADAVTLEFQALPAR